MRISELKDYIEFGNEIEFIYKDKKYSITYGTIKGEDVISFCEAYKESVEVKTVDELLDLNYNGISVKEMKESLTEEDTWIF